ncbi:ABC transporter permease [Saccharopolyspora tripterygii]
MMVLALARTELKLLLRNKTVATSALLMPIMVGVFVSLNPSSDAGPGVWSVVISAQLLMVLGLTVYFAVTAALAARREDRYLKRLRSGEASDAVILAGLLTPGVVLALLQSALMLGISAIMGAPMPVNPLLIVLGLVLCTALCVAAGIATSGRTSSSEQAQFTTLPLFLVLLGSSVLGAASPLALLLPGVGLATLVHIAMTGSGPLLPAIGSLLAWTLLLVLLAKAWFRWEPR